MKKNCEYLRKYTMKITNLKKKKNELINKRGAGIRWKCKKSVIFGKNDLKINM